MVIYLDPQTDKPWATGKGTKKARAEPVPRSKVRKTRIVMIFVEVVISVPNLLWMRSMDNILQLSFQPGSSFYGSAVAGIIQDIARTGQKTVG